jgi:hypothetical protein
VGFFLSGLLLAFPGAILPAWGYHVRPHFVTIGNYFLATVIGLLASVLLTRTLWARNPARGLVAACSIAFLSLLGLSFTAPPVAEWWRLIGFLGLGTGAGVLNSGILHGISAAYRQEPAATMNIAGMLFGLGSAVVAFLVAGAFDVYTVPSTLFLLAMVPAAFAFGFVRSKHLPGEVSSVSGPFKTSPASSPSRALSYLACCSSSTSAMSGRLPAGCRCSSYCASE